MKKVKKRIADGDKGIDQTVEAMWRLINRDLKDEILIKKARELRGTDELETIKNTFDYVIKSFRYVPDPDDVELVTAPIYMINGKRPYGDCDDLVTVLVALLTANKIPCRIKVIAWRRYDYTHVICEVKYKNYWIPLDPVKKADGFGNQVRKVIREKRYDNTMRDLVTLEDGNCGCQSKGRGKGDNSNVINFIVGNSKAGSNGKTEVIEKAVPVPVEKVKYVDRPYTVTKTKIIKTPLRTIANPEITNYREFY